MYASEIIEEYREVLCRPKFGFDSERVKKVIDMFAHVGIGLPGSLYQKCLARELQLRGHSAETEVIVPIRYKGYEFQEKLRIDVLVDGCLVVEASAHRASLV